MNRFSNILLLVDSDSDDQAVLQRAVSLAKTNQATLTVCDAVVEIPSEMRMAIVALTPAELRNIAVTEKQRRLDEMVEAVKGSGVSTHTKVLVGKPFREVIRQVSENGYDLVMKNADRSTGLRDVQFGTTDMNLMRHCPCPVWIYDSADIPRSGRVLAAVDQAPDDAVKDGLNKRILDLSTSIALADFSELHIVHAWRLFGESLLRSKRSGFTGAQVDGMVADEAGERQRWLEDLVEAHRARSAEGAVDYLSPHVHPVEGHASHVVPALARELDVDLIVMGTVARTGISGLIMGNTAESILIQVACSVLAVKPSGFTTSID